VQALVPLKLVSRKQWGARPPTAVTPLRPSRGVVVHYSASDADERSNHNNCAGRVRGIQRYHMDTRGWNDVAYCVDSETEALTTVGWKRYDQLCEGDLVVTLNHETGEAEWQPVERINVFAPALREMVSIEARGHSSLTTLNHRWPVERARRRTGTVRQRHANGRWAATGRSALTLALHERLVVTSETLTCWDRIPTVAPVINLPKTSVYSDAFVELVAWAWTEGHVARSRGKLTTGIVLYQSHVANPHLVERIRTCLTDLYGPPRTSLRARTSVPTWRVYQAGHKTEFRLNHAAGRQVLEVMSAADKIVSTRFITSLTETQLRRFVEVSILADGCTIGPTSMVGQGVEGRLEALQIAATLLGRRTYRFQGILRGTARFGLRISTSRRSLSFWPHRAEPRRVEHDDIVWCPTTPNGTWLARRRGTIYFTGNSYLVCKHGYVFEGRGAKARTAANGTTAGNDGYLAICFLGDDTKGRDDVTSRGRQALVDARKHLLKVHAHARETIGHRDLTSTGCPGDELYAYIKSPAFRQALRKKPPAGWKRGDPIWENLPGPKPKPDWFWDALEELDRRRESMH
jgi:N-acetylmuramoyl-L-alanine amidase